MRAVLAVVGILVVIIVGVMGFQVVQESVDENAAGGVWEYDDYRPADGVVSVNGVLELVETIQGTMIHAAGVGSGTIVYEDREVSVNVTRAVLDVYLMTGQSNSAYYTYDKSQADPVPNLGEAYAWMTETGKYGNLKPSDGAAMRPMVSPENGIVTADKAPAFAATVSEITGNKVYWICGGWGGRSIVTFNPENGTTWTYMQAVVRDAMAAIDADLYEARTMFWMWIQGEADASMPVDEYATRFIELSDAINDGGLGFAFSHCFVSVPLDSGNVPEAQALAAEARPGAITIATTIAETFTQANGLLGSDGVHYTQKGDNLIGVALGEACGEMALNNPYKPPVYSAVLGVLPFILMVAVVVSAIGLALRALMGRD